MFLYTVWYIFWLLLTETHKSTCTFCTRYFTIKINVFVYIKWDITQLNNLLHITFDRIIEGYKLIG
jgi:hypothetical protein